MANAHPYSIRIHLTRILPKYKLYDVQNQNKNKTILDSINPSSVLGINVLILTALEYKNN